MNSAIMEFGTMLTQSADIVTIGESPTFSWAANGDIVILGNAPEDFDGRVCSVKLPDSEKQIFVRLFRNGNKIRAYFMDNYELYKEYPADTVEIAAEVLAVVHQYKKEPETPKATKAWEKRVKKALKDRYIPYRDYEKIIKHHTHGTGGYEALRVAYCLGVATGRKEAVSHDAG